jgi:hypothetical protein
LETIRIPNEATYSPIPLTDLALGAPLLSRILLGATLPGLALQTAALTIYAGSAFQDWVERLGVRRIDFGREFGADHRKPPAMPPDERQRETALLAERINDGYTKEVPRLRELAPLVDRHLIDYIAGITDQRVITSTEVREFSLAKFIFPFALGAADILSGDISIFHDTGVFQTHVLAHEFCHRKGYWRELDAQVLAYLAMTASGDDALVQGALCERLYRDVHVMTGEDRAAFEREIGRLRLRPEIEDTFLRLRPDPGAMGPFADAMRTLYDARMRVTGQNGLSDYDQGFTDFLYGFERSETARQRPPLRGALR